MKVWTKHPREPDETRVHWQATKKRNQVNFKDIRTNALSFLSIQFSRQEYWSGLPFPLPKDLPNPGIKPISCIAYIGRQILYHWATLEGFSYHSVSSVQFSSVAQLCPTLCDPMNRSMPGLPVHHQLPELTQTHVHRVGDAIQPSHPLSSPSPPAPNPSQYQSLFQWVNSSHEVAKVLEFQLLASFLPKNTQDWSPLEWTGWISLQSKELSRVFSNTTVQKHQFFGTQLSSQSNSHIRTWLLEKP